MEINENCISSEANDLFKMSFLDATATTNTANATESDATKPNAAEPNATKSNANKSDATESNANATGSIATAATLHSTASECIFIQFFYRNVKCGGIIQIL